MRNHLRAGGLLLLSLLCTGRAAMALEERSVELDYHQGRYEVHLEVHMDAPLPAVWQIMTDYDHLQELDKSLLETRVLEDSNSPRLVYTRMRDCVLIVCRTIERVERVIEVPRSLIVAIALPERSDVRFAESSWKLTAEGEGTTVQYRIVMEPAFWVPPLMGPKSLLRRMADTGLRMFAAVEERAAGAPAP